MLNTWEEKSKAWTTQYAVRYGKWKFMNFRQENVDTTKCEEGWKNDNHEKYLFPFKKYRNAMLKRVTEIAKDKAAHVTGYHSIQSG